VCGIVGIHLKTPGLESRLGELMVPMLGALAVRGPDSTGIAVYRRDVPADRLKFSLQAQGDRVDWDTLADHMGEGATVRVAGDSAVLVTPSAAPDVLAAIPPGVRVVGWGRAIEVVKDVGDAATVSERYGIAEVAGYQGIGHTRMATESAVTTEHSHPFAPGADLAFVHNGSFSNHATIRRRLALEGVRFETDNDSEVAARFVARQVEEGKDLGDALRMVLKTFDGFFTLLVANEDQFAVVRDSFACKPLVVAETPEYVAVASEYVALGDLPGIARARVFEPMPEELHVWSR
jgi:amidophosphoribosyltransferase